MNYHRIYREFIADRKAREASLTGYTEKHHILPRSLGGGDEAENLVRLTPEDHFFAHLLLAKMHGGLMWQAVCRMRWGRVSGERPWVSGRPLYAIARRRMAQVLSERFKGQAGMRGPDNGRYDSTPLEWTNLDTGQSITATKWEMWDRFGGTRGHWTSAATGSRKTYMGWTTAPGLARIRGGKGKVFNFVNRDGRIFQGRQIDFARAMGISAASVSRITRHGDVTLCGWRLEGKPDRRAYEPRTGGYAWQYRAAERAKRGPSG